MFSTPSLLRALCCQCAALCACFALAACAPSDFGKRKGKDPSSACDADAALEAGACDGEPGDEDDEWMGDEEPDDPDAETDDGGDSDADADAPFIPVDPLAEAGVSPDPMEPPGCL